jgi:hypothetical protein
MDHRWVNEWPTLSVVGPVWEEEYGGLLVFWPAKVGELHTEAGDGDECVLQVDAASHLIPGERVMVVLGF